MIRISFEVSSPRFRIHRNVSEGAINLIQKSELGDTPLQLAEMEYRFRRGERLRLVDWALLAGCAQMTAEKRRYPKALLLPAFMSVFEIRVGGSNDRYLDFYLGNLPDQIRGKGNQMLLGATKSDQVRECSTIALELLAEDPDAPLSPLFPGRNLAALLNFESVTSEIALNAALRPHWPSMWRAAFGSTSMIERVQ